MNYAAEVEQEELSERRQAVEAIRKLYGVRQGKKAFDTEEKAARVAIDNFFLTHPDERELFDDETGYKAYLRSGGTSVSYDSPAAIKAADAKLYARLETLGLFRLDADAVKKALSEGLLTEGDMRSWKRTGEKSPALMVERVKE